MEELQEHQPSFIMTSKEKVDHVQFVKNNEESILSRESDQKRYLSDDSTIYLFIFFIFSFVLILFTLLSFFTYLMNWYVAIILVIFPFIGVSYILCKYGKTSVANFMRPFLLGLAGLYVLSKGSNFSDTTKNKLLDPKIDKRAKIGLLILLTVVLVFSIAIVLPWTAPWIDKIFPQ